MSAHGPRARGTGGRPAGDDAAFERWLGDGLAPDASDTAAGRLLAEAWRDRRRAMAGETAPGAVDLARQRLAWWWAPLTVAAIALVAVAMWPTPAVVDGSALAASYLEAMGALPSGAP